MLPSVLVEASGAELTTTNKVWAQNDSGGNPDLYEFDTSGTLLRTLNISNATNVDWEEIRRDTIGNMYIDDMGNNANDRTNLKIYKLSNFDAISGNSAFASTISFSYPDQFYFPPAPSQMNFDCESFIAYNDSLYLFSKDRSTPYTGFTKLYRLPTQAGSYVAELIDSFFTGNVSEQENSITSAALSPNQSKLMLISHYACWEFTNFKNRNFFKGNVQHYYFGGGSTQYKEGVVFLTENELYLTDEKHASDEGNLYRMEFPQTNTSAETIDNTDGWSIYPNPVSTELRIKNDELRIGKIEISNIVGQQCFPSIIYNSAFITIDISSLLSGVYFLKITNQNGFAEVKKFVKN